MNKSAKRLASILGSVAFVGMLTAGCGAQDNTATNTTTTNNSSTQQSTADSTPANNATTATSTGQAAKMQWSAPPKMQIDTNKKYSAIFHTNYGDFTVELFAKDSPLTVNNFVFLANHHFYENDTFFRIIQPFMVQTGDPMNNGMGGPGYQFKDELPPKIPYGPGIVAMANAGPNTNGSQFFICTGQESKTLKPDYTEFGKVTKGIDVVQKIAAIPVTTNPQGEPSMPTQKAIIKTIEIVEQ